MYNTENGLKTKLHITYIIHYTHNNEWTYKRMFVRTSAQRDGWMDG